MNTGKRLSVSLPVLSCPVLCFLPHLPTTIPLAHTGGTCFAAGCSAEQKRAPSHWSSTDDGGGCSLTNTRPYWSTWPTTAPRGQCVSHPCPYPWPFARAHAAETAADQVFCRSHPICGQQTAFGLLPAPAALRLQNLACKPDHVRAWKGTRPAS